MALFRLSAKIINRRQKRSSIAAANYISGQELHDNREAQVYRQKHKTEIAHTEIILPDNAPIEFSDRGTLWNAVEQAEDKSTRRASAQSAREIVLALPNEDEISISELKELVTKYVTNTFVVHGMIADVAIHDKQNGNPHSHVLLTMREVGPNGFGLKNREWNKQLTFWRSEWEKALNTLYREKGLSHIWVSHKSHRVRGDYEHKPTLHLGPVLSSMERRGVRTQKGDYNRAIEAEREDQKQREQEYQQSRGRERGR